MTPVVFDVNPVETSRKFVRYHWLSAGEVPTSAGNTITGAATVTDDSTVVHSAMENLESLVLMSTPVVRGSGRSIPTAPNLQIPSEEKNAPRIQDSADIAGHA
jgi:hypothetical protein